MYISIEQPLPAHDVESLGALCAKEIVPIALDESLIGCSEKSQLIAQVNPQYVILKPSLVGGVKETLDWIQVVEQKQIGWWMTSALESSVGLNRIAQLAAELDVELPTRIGDGIDLQE